MLAPGIYAHFSTTEGDFSCRLCADLVPNTVENFVALAEGRKGKSGKPFYDGLVFHRVIKGFMIQGGCPEGTGRGGPGYSFADEFHPKLRHSKGGMLSMANAGHKVLITVAPTSHLDNRHSIFGEVISGYDIVEKISRVPTGAQDRPSKDVVIRQLKIEQVK